MCKLRIRCHDQAIERGRYKGLSVEERVCGCNKKNIEDENHFLIDCPNITHVDKNSSCLSVRITKALLLSRPSFCFRFLRTSVP
jgi:hypothetical protein